MKSFFAGKRPDSKQTSMQSTHMQVHTDSNKANNETSTDQHAERCMQTLTECTAAVRDRDPADHLELQRSTCDLLDARSVASHDHDDRPRIFHWPHTQTLDYHCRHSMAIPGDEVLLERKLSSWWTLVQRTTSCQVNLLRSINCKNTQWTRNFR